MRAVVLTSMYRLCDCRLQNALRVLCYLQQNVINGEKDCVEAGWRSDQVQSGDRTEYI